MACKIISKRIDRTMIIFIDCARQISKSIEFIRYRSCATYSIKLLGDWINLRRRSWLTYQLSDLILQIDYPPGMARQLRPIFASLVTETASFD